jgi:hypothetical protein
MISGNLYKTIFIDNLELTYLQIKKLFDDLDNRCYKIINDKTDDEKKEILKKYANNCLLGVKGNWSDYIKKMVMKELMGNVTVGINGGCALCILGVLEQTFNPEEINPENILQKIDPLKMQCLNACKK